MAKYWKKLIRRLGNVPTPQNRKGDFMKGSVAWPILLLLSSTSGIAQELPKPVVVATFRVLPSSSLSQDLDADPASLYMTTVPNELGRNVPSLIREGAKFGINDEVTRRAFWLDDAFRLKSVSHYEVWGELQVDGNHVLSWGNIVQIFKETLASETGFLVKLPGVEESMAGGAWYQADTLFFYDDQGDLHVVEHPINKNPNGVGVSLDSIKSAEAARKLVTDHPERYPTLVWNQRYGLTRDGFPMSRIYNKDWQNFLEDQRKKPSAKPDANHQLVPETWNKSMRLNAISKDGTLYWGGFGGYIITQNGYQIATVKIPHSRPSKVLVNGNIVFIDLKNGNLLELYQFKRWW